LRRYPGEDTQKTLQSALNDPEALIRHTALTQFNLVAANQRKKLLVAMLYDPVKAVRMEAANQLNTAGQPEMPTDAQKVFKEALAEYQDAMTYSADFSFGRFNLGNLFSHQKRNDEAIAQYKAAIAIDPLFYPAKVNLAMLYNQQGNNAEAEKLFRDALTIRNDLAEVHYSLGLLLGEEQRYVEAAEHLGIAALGMPHYARVHYNAGQLWDYLNDIDKAQKALERAFHLEPQNPDYLKALVQFYIKHQKVSEVKRIADQLLAIDPHHRLGRQLQQYIDTINKGY
jgi:tetratricopeptide (TPR) repeat protein